MSIPAEVNNGQVTAKIPMLEDLIEDFSGTRRLRARVEAIVDDTYFETWSDEIVVEQSVKVKSKQTGLKTENNKPVITASLSEVKIVDEEPLEVPETKETIVQEKSCETPKSTKKQKNKDQSYKEKFEELLLKK